MARSSPLLELYLARIREFYRQPARIFWVYGFPTLMAVCLGLAFQSRPPENVQVDLVSGAASAPVEKALRESDARARAQNRPGLNLRVEPAEVALHRLATGKTPLVIEPSPSRPITYHFDPTRPEAIAARAAVDDILQENAGRKDPVETRD